MQAGDRKLAEATPFGPLNILMADWENIRIFKPKYMTPFVLMAALKVYGPIGRCQIHKTRPCEVRSIQADEVPQPHETTLSITLTEVTYKSFEPQSQLRNSRGFWPTCYLI